MSDIDQSAFAEIASEVVAAYVAKNSVPAAELPALIVSVHEAFKSLGQREEPPAVTQPQKLTPAVPMANSTAVTLAQVRAMRRPSSSW